MDLSSRPVALAVALQEQDAGAVVVGGTARWLCGGTRPPRDLDVVVDPHATGALLDALEALGAEPVRRLRGDRRVATPYGPLDVFVAPLPRWSDLAGLRVLAW